MSQFEKGHPYSPRRVGRAVQAPRTGITERLESPGLVTPPPVSEGARLAEQLGNALVAMGGLANSVRHYAATDNAQQAREAAHLEAENEKAAVLDRGHGSLNARTTLPQIRAKFDARDPAFVRPDGVSVDDWAAAIASGYTNGQTDAYRTGFDNVFLPGLTETITSFETKVATEARDENLMLLANSIETIESQDDLVQRLGQGRALFPELTDAVFYGRTVVPAMEAAARRGDAERFAMLSSSLVDKAGNPIAANEQERLRAVLESTQQRDRTIVTEAMRNADAAAELNGATFEERREIIRGHRGRVDEADLTSRLHEVDAQERLFASESARLIKANETNAGMARMLTNDSSLVAAGQAWLIDDGKIEHSDGTTTSVDRKARVDAAMSRQFSEIAAKHPDNPKAARLEMIQASALNDYRPEPWSRLLSAGYAAASDLTLAGDPAKGQPELPPHSVAAFELYRDIKAAGPGLITDGLVPARAKEFYERTITLMEDPAIGSQNPQAAMMAARRDMTRGVGGSISKALDEKLWNHAKDIADVWGSKDAKNAGELLDHMRKWASLYASRGLTDLDGIAKKARSIVENEGVVINGWWTPIGNMNLPGTLKQDINKTAEVVLSDFAKGHKQYLEDRGLDADDLTLTQDQNTGLWMVIDAVNGLPIVITGKPDAHLFSSKTLVDRSDALRREGVISENRARQQLRRTPMFDFQKDFEEGRGAPPFADRSY